MGVWLTAKAVQPRHNIAQLLYSKFQRATRDAANAAITCTFSTSQIVSVKAEQTPRIIQAHDHSASFLAFRVFSAVHPKLKRVIYSTIGGLIPIRVQTLTGLTADIVSYQLIRTSRPCALSHRKATVPPPAAGGPRNTRPRSREQYHLVVSRIVLVFVALFTF